MRSRLAGSALAVAAVLLLAGCSGLPDLLPHQRSGIAADRQALELAWSTPASDPSWIPADARDIRWVAVTTGGADDAPAVVRLRSSAGLPDSCRKEAGMRQAAITTSWAPRGAGSGMRRCGNWVVTSVPGGYYAWTPAAGSAAGAS